MQWWKERNGRLPQLNRLSYWLNQFNNRKLNAAGSYYRVLPSITRRQMAVFIITCKYRSYRSYRFDLSALKMPISGHAVVIRARWFFPSVQQTFLWVESIKQQRLKAAGSHYRILPSISCWQVAILNCRKIWSSAGDGSPPLRWSILNRVEIMLCYWSLSSSHAKGRL